LPKATDIFLREMDVATERIAYRAPMKFGGRVVTDAVLLNVTVVVETRDGRAGRGHGSMPLGNAWAWPSRTVAPEQTLAAMQSFGQRLADIARDYRGCGHPLEISRNLHESHSAISASVQQEFQLPEPMPKLAQLVCASPLDAAIHDAYGKTLGASAYDLLGPDYVQADLGAYLGPEFRGEYLDRYTLRRPKPSMPLYHLVGALDPLTAADLASPLGDGLPETLIEWILAEGLTHLKIKLAGDDLGWDVERVAAVEAAAVAAGQSRGRETWQYSLDFNEKCESVSYVLEFLRRLRERSPLAYDRVQYIEQPTHRDLRAHPHNRMHEAAKLKPVVIDESLVDLDSFHAAREMGYSGIALKACKGHSEALLMGAAAQKYGMFLCVQDLTCPGASFLHSASLAARIPGVAAIEGNARQYCPAGNEAWARRYPRLFRIENGVLPTGLLDGPGLGF
jgi:L-alanine-DL-glutamate epimerase-like enolase superfamily enzyme